MDLKNIKTFEDLKQAKAQFYATGSEIKLLQQAIKTASPNEKAALGKKISLLKNTAETAFAQQAKIIEENIVNEKIANEWVDVTHPIVSTGSLHPLSLVANRFRDWFKQNGYYETTGSEIETEEYNFEKLNIAKDHPARDAQDTLYINDTTLLRTHNTGFSARELAKNVNQAFSHFAIGPVYRNDEDDATHLHQFTQVDFVAVGSWSFPHLKFTLQSLLSYVFEKEVKIRMRPSFFPFTEPSAEVDIYYQNKWIEILGAGMLHDNVLKAAGYTNEMQGIAAGIGLERVVMIKYGINDIRELYRNDLRFLSQFQGGK